MQEVDLVIVHWNQPAACVATVRAFQAQGVPLRITVVDNASEPAAVEELRQELKSVEIVRLDQNKGWGGALNCVLGRKGNAFCFISAHDAVPGQDCLRRLLNAAETDPRIGIACPQYAEPYVVRFSGWRGVTPAFVKPGVPGDVREVDVPHGTLLLVRQQCLQEIGLFDERYFAYGDEHELGARARRKNWKVALVWGAVVENPATSTANSWRTYLFARNSLLLVRDYFGLSAAFLRALFLLLNTLRLRLAGGADAPYARARFRGVRDYFAGRFGPPPPSL